MNSSQPYNQIEENLKILNHQFSASFNVHDSLEKAILKYHQNSKNFPYKQIICYLHNRGGLCNRLMSLWSTLALGSYFGIPVYLRWEPAPACPCNLSDLFELRMLEESSQAKILEILNTYPTQTFYLANMGRGLERIYNDLDLERWMTYEFFQNIYLQMARSFQIEHDLTYKIDQFISNHWEPGIIGVHMRGTDRITLELKKRGNLNDLSSDHDFINSINNAIKSGTSKFFLATDSNKTQSEFTQLFPGRFVFYCQSFNSNLLRETSIQDAMIDLYLLSKTTRIIGSKKSSFNFNAALLGGIPLERGD